MRGFFYVPGMCSEPVFDPDAIFLAAQHRALALDDGIQAIEIAVPHPHGQTDFIQAAFLAGNLDIFE